MKLWKCIPDGMISHGHKWEIGKWYKVEGEVEMCIWGFHASKSVMDAMKYVTPGYICRVEVRGKSIKQDDKQVWSEMMVLSAVRLTKEDSVSLAIYAAELVIGLFEEKHPGDKRPRAAIEAAKNWLRNPDKENADAANAAYAAAYNAYAAIPAARAAANAARAAANAANAANAARAAAYAAYAAAYTANAAYDAAYNAYAAHSEDVMKKCHKWIRGRLKGRTN